MAGGGAQINTLPQLPPGPSQGPSAHQRPHSHTPAGAPGQGARWQPKLGAGRKGPPAWAVPGRQQPRRRLSNPAGRVPSRRGRCVREHRARFRAQRKHLGIAQHLPCVFRGGIEVGEGDRRKGEIRQKKGPVAPKLLAGQHTHPALPCPLSAQSVFILLLNSISDSLPG